MDGGTFSGAAVSSVFVATLRIFQIGYELKAVGEQTRDLLDSTNHVSTGLQAVKTLRRKKSQHLDVIEKKWIDEVLANTEKTLGNVAKLIEPARVDLQTKFGHVGLVNRGLFVFRDSPRVVTNLARLNLASQSLNTAMNILCTREGCTPTEVAPDMRWKSTLVRRGSNDTLSPPSYEEPGFLDWRRPSHVSPSRNCTKLGWCDSKLASAEKWPMKTLSANELEGETMMKSPIVNVDEILPRPSPISNGNYHKDPFEGADGLQACEEWESSLMRVPASQNQTKPLERPHSPIPNSPPSRIRKSGSCVCISSDATSMTYSFQDTDSDFLTTSSNATLTPPDAGFDPLLNYRSRRSRRSHLSSRDQPVSADWGKDHVVSAASPLLTASGRDYGPDGSSSSPNLVRTGAASSEYLLSPNLPSTLVVSPTHESSPHRRECRVVSEYPSATNLNSGSMLPVTSNPMPMRTNYCAPASSEPRTPKLMGKSRARAWLEFQSEC